MALVVNSGSVVSDQIVLYNPIGSFTRPSGIIYSDLNLSIFANNEDLAWPILDGSSILDSQISSGSLFFNELSVSGFYGIRFLPDRIGIWNLSFIFSNTGEEIIKEYAAVCNPSSNLSTGGLNVTFF